MQRILVMGSSGMLGNTIFRYFSSMEQFETFGTVRSLDSVTNLPADLLGNFSVGVDTDSTDSLVRVFSETRPDIVINCIGVIKQSISSADPILTLNTNAILPHRLAQTCLLAGARLVHISTDCVFSGRDGMYLETDVPDAQDLYGVSKRLGEVDYPHAITLRTSIIGHELRGQRSLIDWFLSQQGKVSGFKRAIFSGLPTIEIARLIHNYVIPHDELHGLYHVSAGPINKYELLRLVAKAYKKQIEIEENNEFVIDRSLDSTRFRLATGFVPRSWEEMVQTMHDFK